MPKPNTSAEEQDAVVAESTSARDDKLDAIVKEAAKFFPEEEDADLDSDDVSSDDPEDADAEPAVAEAASATDSKAEIAELRAHIAKLEQQIQARTEKAEDDGVSFDASEFELEVPTGWDALGPSQKAQAGKISQALKSLALAQEQLKVETAFLAFTQSHPDFATHAQEFNKHLASGRFNTGKYAEDFAEIWEHVTGKAAKQELAQLRDAEKAKANRSESHALQRQRPVRVGSRTTNEPQRLRSFDESFRSAVKTVAKQQGRVR